MVDITSLKPIITLEEYGGEYHSYIDAVYEIFERDFIKHQARFGCHQLKLKYHPAFQDRAYTFYHMTHKGDVESERLPDLRRCERMPWARTTVEDAATMNLKFWEQERNGKSRVCIWLDVSNGDNYFVILDVRKTFVLLWTAFFSEYKNQTEKKEKEYNNWLNSKGGVQLTPDQLIAEIQSRI